jgi:hypothetical protein
MQSINFAMILQLITVYIIIYKVNFFLLLKTEYISESSHGRECALTAELSRTRPPDSFALLAFLVFVSIMILSVIDAL